MNVLDRITELRLVRNWTEYQLAEKSELTQSTISSWYRKDILPSIPSLERLAKAFGISVAQFFIDESTTVAVLNEQQTRLLKSVDSLDSDKIDALIHFLELLNPAN